MTDAFARTPLSAENLRRGFRKVLDCAHTSDLPSSGQLWDVMDTSPSFIWLEPVRTVVIAAETAVRQADSVG